MRSISTVSSFATSRHGRWRISMPNWKALNKSNELIKERHSALISAAVMDKLKKSGEAT